MPPDHSLASHKSPAVDTSLRRPSSKRKSTSRPSSAALLGSSRAAVKEIATGTTKEMAASFLQFCAMCEKQITTPCNGILYCSEACRQKDSSKPLSAAAAMDTTLPPTTLSTSSPTAPVLVPRAPTGTSHPHIDTPRVRIPSQLHDFKLDLDPTEWKPKLHDRKHSEAFRYLSKFHRSTSSISITDAHTAGGGGMRIDVLPSSIPTPSLVNTPTTTAPSSLSTSAGFGYSTAADFSVRPLPARPNRWFSSDGATPRGTDLVTPHIVPVAGGEDGGEEVGAGFDLWNKKVVVRGGTVAGAGAKDGLGKLFGNA